MTCSGVSAGLFLGNAAIQRFSYVGGTTAVALGDAFELAGTARGGRRPLRCRGAGALFGDADTITGAARGGADLIYARGPSSRSQLTVVGDASQYVRTEPGGDDIIHARGQSRPGDAMFMEGSAVGGGEMSLPSPPGSPSSATRSS